MIIIMKSTITMVILPKTIFTAMKIEYIQNDISCELTILFREHLWCMITKASIRVWQTRNLSKGTSWLTEKQLQNLCFSGFEIPVDDICNRLTVQYS